VEIRGVEGHVRPGQIPAGHLQKAQSGVADANQSEGADRVQISPVARYLDLYNSLPQVRADKVDAAREAIEAGTLDTEQKLSVALDRLLDDLLSG